MQSIVKNSAIRTRFQNIDPIIQLEPHHVWSQILWSQFVLVQFVLFFKCETGSDKSQTKMWFSPVFMFMWSPEVSPLRKNLCERFFTTEDFHQRFFLFQAKSFEKHTNLFHRHYVSVIRELTFCVLISALTLWSFNW